MLASNFPATTPLTNRVKLFLKAASQDRQTPRLRSMDVSDFEALWSAKLSPLVFVDIHLQGHWNPEFFRDNAPYCNLKAMMIDSREPKAIAVSLRVFFTLFLDAKAREYAIIKLKVHSISDSVYSIYRGIRIAGFSH